jgi:DNA-binding NarL/FixJ family response regulator
MLAILRVDEAGRVVAQDARAEALFGRCVGRRCCDVVSAWSNRTFLCEPGCAGAVVSGAAAERHAPAVVTVRGQVTQLRCVRVGAEVVVVLERAERDQPEAATKEALTPRERQVLQLAASGASTARMAEELQVSESTIRTHADRARQKLGARTRAQAVALGLLRGEIVPR